MSRYDDGMAVRREVLGDAHVDRAEAAKTGIDMYMGSGGAPEGVLAASALGISTWGDFINYTLIGFLWKTLVELLVMPITYFVVRRLKRAEPSYQEALRSASAADGDVL